MLRTELAKPEYKDVGGKKLAALHDRLRGNFVAMTEGAFDGATRAIEMEKQAHEQVLEQIRKRRAAPAV
jgi:hypothetical protein